MSHAAADRPLLRRLLLALTLVICPALLAQENDSAPELVAEPEATTQGEAGAEVPGTEAAVAAVADEIPRVEPEEPLEESEEEFTVTSASELSMLKAISQIESRDGAYGAELPEQLLSLGLALQQQERHSEAMDVFKRGVHLARINDGLYSAKQIPLLQGEIKSAAALAQWAEADELQRYLHRVQLRGLPDGEQQATALLEHATWQFNAYQRGLQEQSADRLVTMWESYRLAWIEIVSTQGDSSLSALPALYGMLRTRYLFADYRTRTQPSVNNISSSSQDYDPQPQLPYRSDDYLAGKSIIIAIYEVLSDNNGRGSEEAINALVMLGDWAQWNKEYADAVETYQLVLAELAAYDAAKGEEHQFFAEPVPLPNLDGLRTLPAPVSAERGNLLLEFGVSSLGKVINLERLDTNEDIDTKANRLKRRLRKTKFRPRYEAGQPVETDKVVRAYDIKP